MALKHELDSLLCLSVGYIVSFSLFVGRVKLSLKFYEMNLAQKHFVNIMTISLYSKITAAEFEENDIEMLKSLGDWVSENNDLKLNIRVLAY